MRLSEMKGNEKYKGTKSVEEQYNELKDSSQEELFSKLSQEVLSQKRNGTFDYESLVKAIEKMRAFLPEQTYKNMMQILETMK